MFGFKMSLSEKMKRMAELQREEYRLKTEIEEEISQALAFFKSQERTELQARSSSQKPSSEHRGVKKGGLVVLKSNMQCKECSMIFLKGQSSVTYAGHMRTIHKYKRKLSSTTFRNTSGTMREGKYTRYYKILKRGEGSTETVVKCKICKGKTTQNNIPNHLRTMHDNFSPKKLFSINE